MFFLRLLLHWGLNSNPDFRGMLIVTTAVSYFLKYNVASKNKIVSFNFHSLLCILYSVTSLIH